MQQDQGYYLPDDGTRTGTLTDTEPKGGQTADTVYQAATVAAALLLLVSAAITMI